MYEALGDRKLTVCRELTKKYETVFTATVKEAMAYYGQQEPKGECVLVIEGRSRASIQAEESESFLSMPLEAHMKLYEEKRP